MRECGRNVELWFLLNRLQPDFRTIADFRMAHRKLLKRIFVVFARSCREMKIMNGETLCLDGTTIRASNGRKQSTSVELSRKKLEYARAQLEAVERFLDGMDENDLHEDRIDHPFALDLDKGHLPDPQTLRERIAFHEKCIEELEKSGRSAMTFTDPECAMMPAKEGGIKACYNVQTVVDASSHMIADFHVTDSPSDRGQIFESIELCRKNLGLESVNVIADKGYESAEDIERCLLSGVAADVGFIQDGRSGCSRWITSRTSRLQKASQKPEDIQACLRAGVLPDCYENTNIRVQVQLLGQVSCFIHHGDGTVTCPVCSCSGKRIRGTEPSTPAGRPAEPAPTAAPIPGSRSTSTSGATASTSPPSCTRTWRFPLQRIPDVMQHSPHNNFGRLKRAEKRVMVFIRRDIRKQKLRQQTSEHPFGTIKHYDDSRHFLCRGKEKVTAEFALSALSYNIRRAIALCGGVPKLIERYRRIVMPKIQKNRGNLREKPRFFAISGFLPQAGGKVGGRKK